MQRFVLLAAVAASVAIAAAAEAAPKKSKDPYAWPAKCSLRQRRQGHRRGPGSVHPADDETRSAAVGQPAVTEEVLAAPNRPAGAHGAGGVLFLVRFRIAGARSVGAQPRQNARSARNFNIQ